MVPEETRPANVRIALREFIGEPGKSSIQAISGLSNLVSPVRDGVHDPTIITPRAENTRTMPVQGTPGRRLIKGIESVRTQIVIRGQNKNGPKNNSLCGHCGYHDFCGVVLLETLISEPQGGSHNTPWFPPWSGAPVFLKYPKYSGHMVCLRFKQSEYSWIQLLRPVIQCIIHSPGDSLSGLGYNSEYVYTRQIYIDGTGT